MHSSTTVFLTLCVCVSICQAGVLTDFKLPAIRSSTQATCDANTFLVAWQNYVLSYRVTTMPQTVDEFLKIYSDYLNKYGAGGYENTCTLVLFHYYANTLQILVNICHQYGTG
jgi:hypothetical protein